MNSTVFIILPVIFMIGLLITVIAVIRYKKHLDKVVAGEEHNLHTKMMEPNTVLRAVLIGILVIWLVIFTNNFSDMLEEIQNLNQQMNQQYLALSNELSGLNDKIDSQNNICEDCQFSLQNVDGDKNTVEMTLRVLLKEYSENTAVTVNFGGDSTVLTNNNGVFTGSIPINLFTNYENVPVLTVETNGVIKSQQLEECPNGYFFDRVLPTFGYHPAKFGYKISYDGKGNMVVSGNMTVMKDDSQIEGITLNTASIVYEVDGTIVKETPLTFINGAAEEIDISGSFSVEKNQSFYICIKSANSAGYTVLERIVHYDWEQMEAVDLEGTYTIFDEKGICLYGEDCD